MSNNNSPIAYENKTSQDVFFDVLRICYFSGSRKRGLEKLLQENSELWRCIRQEDDLLVNFPWVEGYANDFEIFFESLVTALHDDFPTVGEFYKTNHDFPVSAVEIPSEIAEKCLKRVVDCCGPNGKALLQRQNQNRHLLQFLVANSAIKDRLFFIAGWLDENESFFEELRQTLKHIFQNPQYERKLRTWIGSNYSDYWITRRKPIPVLPQESLDMQGGFAIFWGMAHVHMPCAAFKGNFIADYLFW